VRRQLAAHHEGRQRQTKKKDFFGQGRKQLHQGKPEEEAKEEKGRKKRERLNWVKRSEIGATATEKKFLRQLKEGDALEGLEGPEEIYS